MKQLVEYIKENLIHEALSWQILLDGVRIQTLSGRPVNITELIYSYQQAKGVIEAPDGSYECVWEEDGRCIQKRRKGQDYRILHHEDDLKVAQF